MHRAIEGTNSGPQSPNVSPARGSTANNLSPIQENVPGNQGANLATGQNSQESGEYAEESATEIRSAEQGRAEEKDNGLKGNRSQRLEKKTQRQRKNHNPEGNDAILMKTL